MAKDPRMATVDKGSIIEKFNSEGIINVILQQIPSSAIGGAAMKKSISNAGQTPLE